MDKDGLLYERILQYIKDKIMNKELLPGDRLPTEMELAEKFGVSRITSKRALEELRADRMIYRVRGKGSFVADPERMEGTSHKSGEEMDYKKVIEFLIPFSSASGGIMDTIKGASRVVTRKGYILDIKYSNGDLEEEKKLLWMSYEKGMGGIIFYPISDRKNLEILNTLSMNEYPMVSIDRYYESIQVSYVVSDNQKGGYDITKYLLGLGHRKIAFLSDHRIEDATSIRNRYFGYCKALKESGADIHPELVKNGGLDVMQREAGIGILRELLEKGATAFFCINDYVAIFVLQCLKSLEVDVPGEASVAGFDNLDISGIAYTPLTTVGQDMERMGEMAAEYIVDSIEKGKSGYMAKVVPVKIVVRESCGKLGKMQDVLSEKA